MLKQKEKKNPDVKIQIMAKQHSALSHLVSSEKENMEDADTLPSPLGIHNQRRISPVPLRQELRALPSPSLSGGSWQPNTDVSLELQAHGSTCLKTGGLQTKIKLKN